LAFFTRGGPRSTLGWKQSGKKGCQGGWRNRGGKKKPLGLCFNGVPFHHSRGQNATPPQTKSGGNSEERPKSATKTFRNSQVHNRPPTGKWSSRQRERKNVSQQAELCPAPVSEKPGAGEGNPEICLPAPTEKPKKQQMCTKTTPGPERKRSTKKDHAEPVQGFNEEARGKLRANPAN